MNFVFVGILALVGGDRARPPLHMNLLGAILIVVFGFLFVTVSSRLTGEIGSSSNPISGMTVATLLLTCLIFLLVGWTGGLYYVTALSVGGIVCIAASNGGTTSQDLKTGFLVGATPRYQQIAILIGALVSALLLGPILLKLNEAATVYVPIAQVAPAGLSTDVTRLAKTEHLKGPQAGEDAHAYRVWQKTDDVGAPAGKYLVNDAGQAVWLVDPGINGTYTKRPDGTAVRKFDAPKATLMSYIIKGILDRQLPWGLVLFGVMIAVVLEMSGIPSLAFAVGVYLPISSSSPIFVGGLVRWLVDRKLSEGPRPPQPDRGAAGGRERQEPRRAARVRLHRRRRHRRHHHRVRGRRLGSSMRISPLGDRAQPVLQRAPRGPAVADPVRAAVRAAAVHRLGDGAGRQEGEHVSVRRLLRLVALVGAAMSAAPAAHAVVRVDALALPDTGLFASVAQRYRMELEGLERLDGTARVRGLIRCGRVDEACSLSVTRRRDGRDWMLAVAQAILARDGALAPGDRQAFERPDATDEERDIGYLAMRGCDELFRIAAATRAIDLAPGTGEPTPDLLAAGHLAYDLLDYARAESCATRLIERLPATVIDLRAGAIPSPVARARTLNLLAMVLQRRRDWDGALARSTEALALAPSGDALETLAQTLIRLGRTDEAVSACQWAAVLDPYAAQCSVTPDPSHGGSHYLLGNGYARRNYTELLAAYPRAFADARGGAALAAADARLASGARVEARAAYAAVVAAHPGWADARVRLASLDFEDARFAAAIAGCGAALAACPEYGRAHAVLSRALEARRFLVDTHRPGYERRFAATPMPEIPGIERFVVNWKSLSPRHQKRVALSVAPWKAYLPVLIEGGATLYIKPMYMRLSDCPGQEALKDQRIEYDSRLWDDVRGCGGYRTVTGIEDVERTIFDRYNTVLHELTHQVHGVLPADDRRAILEHYRAAKARDDSSRAGFLSRYAAGSVFEYVAEGANALESPRRDAYDPREIVRERLDAIDPPLRALVEGLMARRDVSASYPVAYVGAGDDRVQLGKVDESLPFYRKALARAPAEESAHAALVSALVLGGRRAAALAAAAQAVAAQPASGAVRIAAAQAAWHGGRGLDAALTGLQAARATIRAADRPPLDLALGRLAWVKGDAVLALAAYDSALARQSDDPDALRGKAAALALAGRWDEAFALDEHAVRLRTGIVDLRCDYARDLLRAGRLDAARAQLDAARLLDPADPDAEALRGWADLAAGAPDSARAHAQRALTLGPWCDLGRIVLGAAELRRGDAAAAERAWAPVRERIARAAPPEYLYRRALSTWEEVHTLPAVERALLAEWAKP